MELSVKKSLPQLTLPELEEAERKRQRTAAQMEKDASEIGGAGWDFVRDLLDRGRAEYEEELRRRGAL